MGSRGLASLGTQRWEFIWQQCVVSAGWAGFVILQPRPNTLSTNRQLPIFISPNTYTF